MTRSRNITHGLLFLTSIPLLSGSMVAGAADKVSFNEQIRPIFISKCTKCHGGAKAKGDLSLIYRSEVLGKGKSGKTIIVPGKPDKSELFRRIITDDIDDKMPLQEGDHADEPLDKNQVNLIRKWIEQGAKWEEHWAYIKPKNHPLPKLKNAAWVKTSMDQFVLSRLEKNALHPMPPAGRAQWHADVSLQLRDAIDVGGRHDAYPYPAVLPLPDAVLAYQSSAPKTPEVAAN